MHSADFWDGKCFEEATSKIDPFIKLAIHGGQGEMQHSKYELLKSFWAAGCPASEAAPVPPELEYSAAKKWKPKATYLWPAVGCGVISVIHLSPEYFALDPSKTRVLRREGGRHSSLTLGVLASAIRTGVAVWCATTRAPELPVPRSHHLPPKPPKPLKTPPTAGVPVTRPGGAGSSSDPPPSIAAYAEEIVGNRISVYWEHDRKWYDGLLDEYDATHVNEDGQLAPHHITYDDDDDEFLHLGSARWTFLVESEHGGGEMPLLEGASARRTGRRRAEVSRDFIEQDFRMEPAAKRAARSGKAYADESVAWRSKAKQVFDDARQAVKTTASSGDLLKELQAYREAFAKLEQVLK